MKIKKEYIALAVVTVGLLLYIFSKNTNRTHYDLPVLTPIEKPDITKMVISRSSGSITLQRQDDRWMIEPQGYPADQMLVDRMLDAAADVALTSLVSESGSYSHYDLTDDKKIGLEIFTGDQPSLTFDIGKTASTYHHTFVRLEQDGSVYQARNNLRQPFDTDIGKLRDKNVGNFDKTLVTAISLMNNGETIEIAKPQIPPAVATGDGTDSLAAEPAPLWQTADGRTADEGVIDGILTALGSLKCESFAEGRTKEDFKSPIFSIAVEGSQPITLHIFAEETDKKYPAVSSQSEYPFFLSEWMVTRIMKSPGDLVKAETAGE